MDRCGVKTHRSGKGRERASVGVMTEGLDDRSIISRLHTTK